MNIERIKRKTAASLYDDVDDDTTVDCDPGVEVINNKEDESVVYEEEEEEQEKSSKTIKTESTISQNDITVVLEQLQRLTKAVEDLDKSVWVCYREVADLRFDLEDEKKMKRLELESNKVTPESHKRSRSQKSRNTVPPGQLTLTQLQR